jgi:hypothetical protein
MARSFITEIADPVSVFKKPNDFLLADDDGQFFLGTFGAGIMSAMHQFFLRVNL